MIPILFNKTEKEFLTNGLGRLTDCISCFVLEERNGRYECEFQYPINGVNYSEIKVGRLIYATHDDTKEPQPFEIYRRSAEINGIVTFYAHHISYRLADVTVKPFTAGSCVAALNGILDNSINFNPFSFWTDKTTIANFENSKPRSARNMLGGEENSILDVFGTGDYEFDKFAVKLHAHRGVDSGVVISYSKNMTDLRADESLDGVYNAIVPYWADSEGNLVMLPEEMLVYSGVEPVIDYLTDHNGVIIRTHDNEPIEVAYEMVQAVPMDLSDAFSEAPTVNQLRNMARTRFEQSQAWLADETIDVDFVHLWQTEEYKDYAALQRVKLCDTVSVYYKDLGIEAVKKKVVKTVYDVLLDRYSSIELGTPSVSLAQAMERSILEAVPTTSMMDEAIQYATNLIRGGLGGYVVMTPGPNGYPQEILIMDTPDINTAVNVWRFNQGGLGHSSNGYEGPYSDIALTQDGRINASMITAGILNANLIRAGVIRDESGRNYWDLEAGFFSTEEGEIAGMKISPSPVGIYHNNPYMNAPDFGITSSNVFTQGRLTDSLGTTSIGRSELRSGYINILGAYNTSTPPDDWNDYDQIATIRGGYDINGNREFRIQVNSFNYAALVFNASDTFPIYFGASARVSGNFSCSGTKNRRVETINYSDRLLYCYETPTPLFGDIGEAVIDEDGFCYVDIDDIFSETIAEHCEYQVFLQAEGEGDCYISDKASRYFVIKGTPNLRVAWELKAKQKDYQNIRLEQAEDGLETHSTETADDLLNTTAISEMEGLLYEFN